MTYAFFFNKAETLAENLGAAGWRTEVRHYDAGFEAHEFPSGRHYVRVLLDSGEHLDCQFNDGLPSGSWGNHSSTIDSDAFKFLTTLLNPFLRDLP